MRKLTLPLSKFKFCNNNTCETSNMFAKPFKVKSQTAIKGSDRKKLRGNLRHDFPHVDAESLSTLIPTKDEMSVVKIYTHGGDSAVVYVVQKNPIFFQIFDRVYPTVYSLWKTPELLPTFTTWPPVFKKMVGGADLMLPGIVVKSGTLSLPVVNKGDLCAINLAGNRSPVAIGTALYSTEDMIGTGMKGKGFRICHIFGDELWSFGDKTEPPQIPDPDFNPALIADTASDEDDVNSVAAPLETLLITNQSEEEKETAEGAKGGSQDVHIQEKEASLEPEIISQAEMDRYLYEALLNALKLKVKKSDLPLLTSNLYRNFMLPCSTRKEILDVKKSSHKKLSKFLNSIAKSGLIKVKELSKGVESLIEVDRSHPDYRNFEAEEISITEDTVTENSESSEKSFHPPQILEMYSVTPVMLPIFKPAGYNKGRAMSSCEVRAVITDYVKSNDLQVENKKSVVQLDPVISDVVLRKDEVNTTHLSWEELLNRFLDKMQIVHQLTLHGQSPVIKKGKMDPISIDVAQRASNKKVTLVENLDVFGIDPAEFAHTVQLGVACSVTTNQLAQKNKGLQVVVQGNQAKFIADLLLDTYKIPRKFIKGLEKVPKSGKQKRP